MTTIDSRPGRLADEDDVETVDVVVLGTGAAGLTAAVAAHGHGASVVVLEKADAVGGTSAWSGGMVWIPCNHHQFEAGFDDSRDEVLTYLESLSFGTIEPHLAEAFVDGGPEMMRWLEDHTPVRFELVEGFPDYHPERPGGKTMGGRSLECPLFPYDELGEWAARVTRGPQMAGNTTMNETTLGRGDEPDADELARRAVRDERGCGQALVGRLLRACLDRGIEPRTGAAVHRLLMDDDAVVGVQLDDGTRIRARGGVVLATGGFEKDPAMVRSFLRGPLERSVSVPTNTGDGLKMAQRAGASLGNMREAWWTVSIDVSRPDGTTFPWMVNRERTRPRTIMVNKDARRFANEAANYNAFGAAFHQIDVTRFEYSNLPAWMVFDQLYLSRYGLAGYRGEGEPPDWLVRADSLDELAERLGIDGAALADTVERWNAHAAGGADPDFGRGTSKHDTWWGDANQEGVATTLGPIDAPPYWAAEVHIAALGTKGGPRTTGEAQVIDVDGDPIPGLYAAGNVMSSVMGMTYAGAGGTLGPGMVFGFLGGRAAATAARRKD